MTWRPLLAIAIGAAILAGLEPQPSAAARPADSRPLAIVGATLIDGQGGAPLPDSVILVRDGRIAAAGPRTSTAVPSGAEVIEADGKFVIPGLVDGHVHYRSWLGELCLNYGVTSVIDVGNVTEWMVALKEAVANRTAARMPNLFSSGWSLEAPGGGGSLSGSVKRSATYRLPVEGVEGGRKQVAHMIDDQGVDLIKVFQTLPPDVLKAVAEETHRRGKKVMGHTDNVYESVENGMDAVAHTWAVAESSMSPEDQKAYRASQLNTPYSRMVPGNVDKLVAFMVERRTYFNPLFTYEQYPVTDRVAEYKTEASGLLGRPELAYIPTDAKIAMIAQFDRVRNYTRRLGNAPFVDALSPQELAKFKNGYRSAQDFVRKFAKAGGSALILAGTDSGGASTVPGLSLHHELQLLVDAGLTPMQAIVSATKTPAELIGKLDQIGVVAPGRLADLVILDADPLRDIANTKRINTVILHGERVERGYHWNYSIPFTNPVETDNVTSDYLPVPHLERTTPLMVRQGAAATAIRINGSGFTTRSTVLFNNRPVPTRYENLTAISADVPATLLTVPGTWSVEVRNPQPGGGTSNALGVIVAYAPSPAKPSN